MELNMKIKSVILWFLGILLASLLSVSFTSLFTKYNFHESINKIGKFLLKPEVTSFIVILIILAWIIVKLTKMSKEIKSLHPKEIKDARERLGTLTTQGTTLRTEINKVLKKCDDIITENQKYKQAIDLDEKLEPYKDEVLAILKTLGSQVDKRIHITTLEQIYNEISGKDLIDLQIILVKLRKNKLIDISSLIEGMATYYITDEGYQFLARHQV